eukprot:907556_1
MGGSVKLWLASNEADKATLYLGHNATTCRYVRSNDRQDRAFDFFDPGYTQYLCNGIPNCKETSNGLSLDEQNCECTGRGANYDGTRDFSETDKKCLTWSNLPDNKKRFHHLPSNYCRNPDSWVSKRPWCFTGKYFGDVM